jgi:CcmD family protein
VVDFLQANALYLVLLIAMIGWLGIFLYLRKLDKKITHLEKQGS